MLVQKYGGSSVATVEKINAVAKEIKKRLCEEQKIIVVVSAMSGETDDLILLGNSVGENIRELDQLVSLGENKTVALLSLALNKIGVKAISLLGWQAGIVTDNNFGGAFIDNIKIQRLENKLKTFDVLVIAGFQGVTINGNVTTLGKGGSDTTAVALASVMKCSCEIFTDVSGVFSADPKIIPNAKRLEKISYDELMEMSANGAKVMETRSVEIAKKFCTPLEIKQTLGDKNEGTVVMGKQDNFLEEMKVKNITSKDNVCLLSFEIENGKVLPKVLKILSQEKQKISFFNFQEVDGGKFLNFIVDKKNTQKIIKIIKNNKKIIKNQLKIKNNLAKITFVGSGFMTHTQIFEKVLEILNQNKINFFGTTVSEISLSVLVEEKNKIFVLKKFAKEFLS